MYHIEDLREKLKNCREFAPGLKEETYRLTEYLACVGPDEADPFFLGCWFQICMNDVAKKNVNGIHSEYLNNNAATVLSNSQYFIQIVDKLGYTSFAREFREICKRELNFDPPIYGKKNLSKESALPSLL